MITRIQSVHFDADLKLLNLVQERIERLTRYVQNKAVEAKVVLKLERVGQVQDKVIEVIINLPGQPLIAKSTKKSFEEALTHVISTLKKQLLRYKEKIQKKH
jgi:putative sigma-54 modulation protein